MRDSPVLWLYFDGGEAACCKINGGDLKRLQSLQKF